MSSTELFELAVVPPPIFELPLAFILGSKDSMLEGEEPLPEIVTSSSKLPKTALELSKEFLEKLPKEPLNELPELPEDSPDTLPEEPFDELPELPEDRVDELPKKPPDELPELPEDSLNEPPEDSDEPSPLKPGRSSGVEFKSMSRLKKARNVGVVRLAMRSRIARRKESVNDETLDVDCYLIVRTMYLKGVMLNIYDKRDVDQLFQDWRSNIWLFDNVFPTKFND